MARIGKKLSENTTATTRRTRSTAPALLTRRVALAGTGAVALAAIGSKAAAATGRAGKSGAIAAPPLDTSHATRELADLVENMFRQKQARSLEGFMSYFSRRQLTYVDAIWGGDFRGWSTLNAQMADVMLNWPSTVRAYPTKVIGDTRSAMFFFYDSAEMFGHEIRAMAPLDFQDGKIVRQVDYWDGRHFTIEATKNFRLPPEQFPTEFGEVVTGENASPVVRGVATALADAFASADAAAAAELFSFDATFEDLTLKSRLVGRPAIGGFLERASGLLPYGRGSTLRHVVGSAQGGGYEWSNPDNPGGPLVNNGTIALELDREARISGLTALWDGALISDAALGELLTTTVEH